MFPCPTCGDAVDQVNSLVTYMNNVRAPCAVTLRIIWTVLQNDVSITYLWLDIEGPQYWYDAHAVRMSYWQSADARHAWQAG